MSISEYLYTFKASCIYPVAILTTKMNYVYFSRPPALLAYKLPADRLWKWPEEVHVLALCIPKAQNDT